MNGLSLAIATDHNGNIKMVMSRAGIVLLDTYARLPHNPTQANYATALRLLADTVVNYKPKNEETRDER